MAEKSGKKTKKKPAKADPGVLGNLSATRPTRIGGERRTSSRPAAASAAKTATVAKPAAAKAKPKAAAKPKTAKKPKVRTAAGTAPKPPAAPPKGWQTPGENGDKGGPDLVMTAVQAAGEIAQLGVTVGGQLLKRAASRIPRP
jgi:hypothetical protein